MHRRRCDSRDRGHSVTRPRRSPRGSDAARSRRPPVARRGRSHRARRRTPRIRDGGAAGIRPTRRVDAGEGREPADGSVRIGVEQQQHAPAERLVLLLGRPGDVEILEDREPCRSCIHSRRQRVSGHRQVMEDREGIEPEQQRLRPTEGCIGSDVTPIAKRHQTGDAGVHVAAGVAEAEGCDGEVGQQIDALEMGGARGVVIRALVEGAQRRRRAGHHVGHPGSAARDSGGEAQCLLLRLLPNRVLERDRIGSSGIDLALRRRLAGEIVRGRLRQPHLAKALHEAGQGLSAGGGVVGGHAVDHPLQRASATTAGSEPGGGGRVGRVDEDCEPGRKDDGGTVDGDAHPAAAVAHLVREALGDRCSTLRTEKAEFAGGGRAGQVHSDGVVGPAGLEDRLSCRPARVVRDELHLRPSSSTAGTAVVTRTQ